MKRLNNNSKIGKYIGIFAIVLLFIGGILKRSNTNPGEARESSESADRINQQSTQILKKEIVENFQTTSWYPNIRNVLVKRSTIEIYTNLPARSINAERICGGVSGLFYTTTGTDQNTRILVLGDRGQIIVRREGISDECN